MKNKKTSGTITIRNLAREIMKIEIGTTYVAFKYDTEQYGLVIAAVRSGGGWELQIEIEDGYDGSQTCWVSANRVWEEK